MPFDNDICQLLFTDFDLIFTYPVFSGRQFLASEPAASDTSDSDSKYNYHSSHLIRHSKFLSFLVFLRGTQPIFGSIGHIGSMKKMVLGWNWKRLYPVSLPLNLSSSLLLDSLISSVQGSIKSNKSERYRRLFMFPQDRHCRGHSWEDHFHLCPLSQSANLYSLGWNFFPQRIHALSKNQHFLFSLWVDLILVQEGSHLTGVFHYFEFLIFGKFIIWYFSVAREWVWLYSWKQVLFLALVHPFL